MADGGTHLLERADDEEHWSPVGLHRGPDDGARSVDDRARSAWLAGIRDPGRQGDRFAAPAKSFDGAQASEIGRVGCHDVAARRNEKRGAQRWILAPGTELANHLDRRRVGTGVLEELAHALDLLRQDMQPELIGLPGPVRELGAHEERAEGEGEKDEHEQEAGPQG